MVRHFCEAKPERKQGTTVTMRPTLRERLRQRAWEERRSFSATLETAVGEYLEHHETEDGNADAER